MDLHDDQLELTTEVAARLLTAALPEVSADDVRVVESLATTSHVVRIGTSLTARFPMIRTDADTALSAIEAEHRAMAEFARHSPVPAPVPVVIGRPDPDFPMPWSVQTWVPGEVADPDTVAASDAFAQDLGELILALRRVPVRGRPFMGPGRGGDLAEHDEWVRLCLERSHGLLPVPELAARWSRWRDLERSGPDVMSHRDLIPANLLCSDGRLTGVLDTGGFSPADPALDLVVGWHLLDHPRRALLRDRLDCSELEWERGAAWAFEQAIGLVWYYERSHPPMAALGRSTLRRLLEDATVGGAR